MTGFQKAALVYRGFALLFLNTVLIGLIVAGVVLLVSRFKRAEEPENPVTKYGLAQLQPLYPGRSAEDIVALLNENWGRALMYEPYTQFTEAPFEGRFVNVTEAGYRKVADQGPWPPQKENFNVFVFGGSTTFGYGVADEETIPSQLQQRLGKSSTRRVSVYNFGRAYYYSSQERILFGNLLAGGVVADVAVFIDGLNEFHYRNDVPEYSLFARFAMNESFPAGKKLAEETMAEQIRRRVKPAGHLETLDAATANSICERYLRNREMIEAMANARRIKTVFVWQPVPTYKFDLKFHPFAENGKDFGRHRVSGVGYQHMAQWRQTNAPASNELWLADMQENAREPLYVDAVHYSPKMCGLIADEIARALRERLGVKSAALQ